MRGHHSLSTSFLQQCHPGHLLLFSLTAAWNISSAKTGNPPDWNLLTKGKQLGKEAFGVALVFQNCVKSFKACIVFQSAHATCLLNKSLQESIQFTGELQNWCLHPFLWTVYYILAIHLLLQICLLASQHNSWKHMWTADCSNQIFEEGKVNSSHGTLFLEHRSQFHFTILS